MDKKNNGDEKSNIIKLSDYSNDPLKWTVEQMIDYIKNEFNEDKDFAQKAFCFFIKEGEGGNNKLMYFSAGNMDNIETIGWLTIAKQNFMMECIR